MNNISNNPSSAPSNIQETVKKVRDLIKKEQGYESLAHQNKLEAMMVAFDIGQIIENEVLGAYGENRMAGFANLCGFKSVKTAYNYLYLYRASNVFGIPALLTEHYDLPRTYWYAIGSSIKWESDMFGDMVRRSLLQYPLWKESDANNPADPDNPDSKHIVDNEKLGDVCKALKDLRNDFKQGGILYAYQAYELHLGKAPKGMDEMNKWFANRNATTIYPLRTEDSLMEGFTFINERMPIPGNKWQDICYLLNFNPKDDQAITDALERIAKFHIAVSSITGWNHFAIDIGVNSKQLHDEFKVEPRFAKGGYKAIKYAITKKEKLKELRQQSPNIEMTLHQDKLIHGDCLAVLKSNAFSKRSIDACLTDSPYGEEVYCEWREHTKVYHHEPKTTKEAAELLGSVAQVLVNREIIKEQFAWFSFVPIDWVHIFLPPVLNAFTGLNIKHQVLVWDKDMLGKAGGYRTFARQAEAILYVNVGNRALFPITLEANKKPTNMHSSVLKYKAESKAGENEFWKPLGVLEHLIRIATGEDDSETANRQVILDPFCGSGSTGVAAINCNRDFRLIESHDEQFRKAKDNILMAAGTTTTS